MGTKKGGGAAYVRVCIWEEGVDSEETFSVRVSTEAGESWHSSVTGHSVAMTDGHLTWWRLPGGPTTTMFHLTAIRSFANISTLCLSMCGRVGGWLVQDKDEKVKQKCKKRPKKRQKNGGTMANTKMAA